MKKNELSGDRSSREVREGMAGERELRLFRKAVQRHERIFPCPHKRSFGECFTRTDDRLVFWYNTEDQTTHVQMEDA